MKFIDLSQTIEFDPDVHLPLFCRMVSFRPQKGTANILWTITLVSECDKGAEDEALPQLPTPFHHDRAKLLEAMGGGVSVQNRLLKFKREGALSIVPMKGGEPDIDAQAASLDPCTIHLAVMAASENKARLTWRITVVADSSKATHWVELMQADVWVRFELAPGNPQLSLFGGRSNVVHLHAEVDEDDHETIDLMEPKAKRTRRGGKRARADRDEVLA